MTMRNRVSSHLHDSWVVERAHDKAAATLAVAALWFWAYSWRAEINLRRQAIWTAIRTSAEPYEQLSVHTRFYERLIAMNETNQ
jgi:hypothetical protein